MDLVDVWPLFGLRLITPRLELRPVRDDDLPGLAEAALRGIHPPERMPFAAPWTDAPAEVLRRDLARFVWRSRAELSPQEWSLVLAVVEDGVPIGVQDLRGSQFATLRTVSSGSWLTRSRQGHGFGVEMRAAILMFAFDHLGAEVAESGAATWNTASLSVSRRLGYVENGQGRFTSRAGEITEELHVRVTPEGFRRPDWELRVEGVDAARAALVG